MGALSNSWPVQQIRMFIDGSLVDAATGQTFPDVDPATGEVFAEVALGSAEDVDRAVAAAKRALRGPWGSMPTAERLDRLARVADLIDQRAEDFLAAEIRDTGKPAAAARALDIPRGAANFRFFANLARTLEDETFHTPGVLNYTLRAPLGVVGVICPWNLPLLLMTWKVAPALAAGNTVVVKPSEETPATATLLAEVMTAAGILPGVYNVVHGFGPDSAGEALTRHPDVSALTFTGESRTGEAIMRAAAPGLKALSFELGGKNASLVFADADFDAALEGTVRSVFSNAGQVCLCSERVYVERPLYERFVAALAERARGFRYGDPYDPATTMGPLISEVHRAKVLSYYELAVAEGATVVTGGSVPDVPAPYAGGFHVAPTIWTGLPDDARCMREEIFGPVCHVRPFDREDEAVALANDSEYGLCAAVWTRDLARAHRVAQVLAVGLTWINSWYLRDLRTPFGGVGRSGIGREGGRWSMDFYSEIRNVCVKL